MASKPWVPSIFVTDASIRGLDNFGNEDTDLGIEQLTSGGAQLKIDGPESISLLEALATLSPPQF